MREILFRGKTVKSSEWHFGMWCDEGYDADFPCIVPNYEDRDAIAFDDWEVDPSTVGQFTGLFDKNGKKIFEGDIVLKRTYNGKRPFPVTFDSGEFHAGYGGGSSTPTHGYTLDDKQIEVIGNIHDNPELLEAHP